MNDIIIIDPKYLGHNKGSIPPGRDKFFELKVPNFFETPDAIYLIQLIPELDHRCRLFYVIHAIYSTIENLVLWAGSEAIGCAVNPAASGTGVME